MGPAVFIPYFTSEEYKAPFWRTAEKSGLVPHWGKFNKSGYFTAVCCKKGEADTVVRTAGTLSLIRLMSPGEIRSFCCKSGAALSALMEEQLLKASPFPVDTV